MDVLTRVVLIVLIKLTLGVENLRDIFPIEYASDELLEDLVRSEDTFIWFLLLLAQRLFHRQGKANIQDLIRRAVRSRTGPESPSATITSADLEQARYIDIRNQAYEEALQHCDVFGCTNANSYAAIPGALRDPREATAYLSGWYEGTSDAAYIKDESDSESDGEEEEEEEVGQDDDEEEEVVEPANMDANEGYENASDEETVQSNADETKDATDSMAGFSGVAAIMYHTQDNVTLLDAATSLSDARTPHTKSTASPSAPQRKRPAPSDSSGRKQASSGKQYNAPGTDGNDKDANEDEGEGKKDDEPPTKRRCA